MKPMPKKRNDEKMKACNRRIRRMSAIENGGIEEAKLNVSMFWRLIVKALTSKKAKAS
jgi:hypothetical protein